MGHNPSEQAWATGYHYANPTNKMWALLTGTFADGGAAWPGIVPAGRPLESTRARHR